MTQRSVGRSILWRAILAIALMVGFYTLAVGLSAVLVWIPYAEWMYANRLHLKLAAFCLIGAFVILKSVLPRWDRFEAPGPMLHPERHPRLFAELRGIAAGTGQEMPAEVFLVPDVNAWVSQRGGVMGFGSRRVMGLGLPLLSMLRVSELRAVLAHEFGHYHGGDVKLGPWIYKTREALVRTVVSLAEHSGMLMKPFEWYGRLFFRITHAVSRHQELQADALAASVAGASALAGGLRAVHRGAIAFQPYWSNEVVPVLNAGFLPPLAGGFDRFMNDSQVAQRLAEAVEQEEREDKHDPYDTHPSLRERLAALGNPSPAAEGEAGPYALELLEDVNGLEQQMLADLSAREESQKLKRVAWDEVGRSVWVPNWEEFVAKHGALVKGWTPAMLPTLDWNALDTRVAQGLGSDANPKGAADFAIGAALSVALVRRGFDVETPPGGAVILRKGDARIEPFNLRKRLHSGHSEVEQWHEVCRRLGIEDLDLGSGPDMDGRAAAAPAPLTRRPQ